MTLTIDRKAVQKVFWLMKQAYRFQQFLTIRGIFGKCCAVVLSEIDEVFNELIARNSEEKLDSVEWYYRSDYESISSDEQERIRELLISSAEERRRFLGAFPIFKSYRLETIECLLDIAKEIQKAEKHTNHLNLWASASGLSAGIINAVKCVSENVPLPETVQKAAPILSAINGLIRSYTCTTKERNLERLTKKAGERVKYDKMQFQLMMRWFEYNVELMNSVKSAIGSDVYKFIFVTLKSHYEKIRSSDQSWKTIFEVMIDFCVKEGYRYSLAIPLVAASLKLFVLLSSALLSLDWTDAAALYVSRITNYGQAMVYGARVGMAAKSILEIVEMPSNNTSLISSELLTNVETSCSNAGLGGNELGATHTNNETSKSNSNTGAYLGIILDIGPAIFDISRLVTGDVPNEQAAKISQIAETLRGEIRRIENVYAALNLAS